MKGQLTDGTPFRIAFVHKAGPPEGTPDPRAAARLLERAMDEDNFILDGDGKLRLEIQKLLDRSPRRRTTTCSILLTTTSGTSETYSTGEASCSPLDRFVKETGRVHALARALEAFPSKEDRRTIWEAYQGRFGTAQSIARGLRQATEIAERGEPA